MAMLNLGQRRIIRIYEVVWIAFAAAATFVFITGYLGYEAMIIFGFAGTALVFGGMMDVLPGIIEEIES